MISLDIIASRVSAYSCASCAVHNPRGHHSHLRAEIYVFTRTISCQKAGKCLVLQKSIYYDDFPTSGTRVSREKGPFFLIYTKAQNKLAAARTTWLFFGSSGLEVGHSPSWTPRSRAPTTHARLPPWTTKLKLTFPKWNIKIPTLKILPKVLTH